jgi:hypothetical protein
MARSPQTKPPSKKRTPNATRAKYPRHSVERALRIPKAILDQNAGKPVTPEEAAVLLGVTTAKGPINMGHYGHICGRIRANEKFSGRGHRDHICKDCQRPPREERDRVTCLDELYGFLEQSHISQKNIDRLGILKTPISTKDYDIASARVA